MTKLFFLCRRRGDLTHDEYVERLLGGHVPLAHHGMSRYVTSVVEERLGADAPPYDGFAEIHFASPEDLERRLYLSAEGQAVIERDVGRFLGTIHAYYVAEHVARWVEHRPGRFSIRVGDAEAFLVYERRGDVLDLLHTYTPPALRGRNLAAELTRAALEHARAEGLRVVPTCAYTRRYLARHPELRGLVG